MKRVTVPVCLAFALAANLAAQTGPPERQPGEGDLTNISFTPEARVESSVVLSPEVSFAPAACTPNATTYCANGNRFQVSVIFSAPSLGITNAPAQAVPLTGDTGYFWFFSSNNVELVIKVVDGRAFNDFFWVFYGALSDVAYTITVIDTQAGTTKTYSNPAGHLGSFADTAAFAGGASCTYSLSPSGPQSFGSSGGAGSFSVLTQSGCSWNAASNAAFVTITGGSSGTGNGVVTFSVAANSSTSARTGTLTAGGQTYTVNQAGVSGGGGAYDGVWSGTTNQTCQPSSGAGPCGVSWTISNSNLIRFEIHYAGPACGIIDAGTTITYSSPRAVNPASFNVTSSGSPPVRADFNVNVTATTTSATGSGSVTLTTSSPLPSCTTTVPITFNATKN